MKMSFLFVCFHKGLKWIEWEEELRVGDLGSQSGRSLNYLFNL